MKYQITPFIVAVGAAIIYATYSVLFLTAPDDRKSMIYILLGFMVPTLILILGVDYLMQKYMSKLWLIYTIQLAVAGIWGTYQMMGVAQKKLILPDTFTAQYIIVVFGIENAPALPSGRSFNVNIPNDGVLLTSDKDPNSQLDMINNMETVSGKKIDYLTGDYQWVSFETDSVEINNKRIYFKGWTNISVIDKDDNPQRMKNILLNKLSQ